ncbi:radical activating enzyme [Nocardioides baekrokdamisoli]|uniref:Radical activating enzyme n=1 Tax=Nocardioides baekrokdamisoli TaxID=1804624 RepID=A0A3G9J1Y4_9ACTN|nr:4Fe-4S single cluster domain-containing protein [Nocardioides baekrokdamisoli]BBH16999.1 radical activating enzyme [Nocardioides baekrokdamisoli]
MSLRISRIAAPITVLGPGRRVVVWVQGCTLACAGCASADTWSARGGREMSVEEVTAEVLRLVQEYDLDGLTISGGEPFQQAEAVADVLAAVRAARADLDTVAFTGYDAAVARRRSVRLARLVDILVAGRYDPTQPSDRPLLASANQKIVTSDRGADRLAEVTAVRVQVAADEDDLFVVGLPQPGDLDRLREALEARGVALAGASWR